MSDEEKVDFGENNKKKKVIYMTIGIISGIIIIILGVFLNSFTKNYLYNGKIGHNIFVEDVDISHLSKEEAIKQISDKYTPQNLNLKYEDLNFEVKAEDIDYKYNIEDIVKDAYNNTRTGSYFKDIINYLSISVNNKNYDISSSYDDDSLNKELKKIADKINREPINAKVNLSGGKIVVTPSNTGLELQTDKNKEVISKALTEMNNETIELGVAVTQPRIKTEDVNKIDTNLSSFTTSFNSSQVARSYNIGLAASKCNGAILLPGETFSYNEHTGQRTLSNGYKSAPVIMNGSFASAPGGGVCQTSTTLFNAVLLAGLDITDVQNHSITSSYAPRGRDAMVSDGSSDLQFKNNFDHAVYIACYRSGSTVSAAVYGASQDRVGVSIRVDNFTYNGKPAAKTYRTITKNGESKESFIYTSVYKR